MEVKDLVKIIKNRQKVVLAIMVTVFVLALVYSVLQPFKYSTETKLLIVQSSSSDPYTISRSNEYLGKLFTEVAYSTSFISLVKDSQFDIDQSYFQSSSAKLSKQWKKDVHVQAIGDTGVIEVIVYHQNPHQSQQLALGITKVLMTENYNYQGMGDAVKINVIDQPTTSNYPVKPNILVNLAGALILGALISLFYVSIFPEADVKPRKVRVVKRQVAPARVERVMEIQEETEENEEDNMEEYNIPFEAEDDEEGEINIEVEGNIKNVFR